MELESAKYFQNSQPPPDLAPSTLNQYAALRRYDSEEDESHYFLTILGVNLALFVLIFSWVVSLYAVVKLARLPPGVRFYNSGVAIIGRVLDQYCRTPDQQWMCYWIASGLVILCLTFIGSVPVTKSSLAACKASPLAHWVLTVGAQMRGSDAYAFVTAAVYMILGTTGAVIGFSALLTPNHDKVLKLEMMIIMSFLAQIGTVGGLVGGIRLFREMIAEDPVPPEELADDSQATAVS